MFGQKRSEFKTKQKKTSKLKSLYDINISGYVITLFGGKLLKYKFLLCFMRSVGNINKK